MTLVVVLLVILSCSCYFVCCYDHDQETDQPVVTIQQEAGPGYNAYQESTLSYPTSGGLPYPPNLAGGGEPPAIPSTQPEHSIYPPDYNNPNPYQAPYPPVYLIASSQSPYNPGY